jgi:hypothetical protein
MDIISLVTGDAGISQPLELQPALVTVQTRKPVMRAPNRYRGTVVAIWQPFGIKKVAHGWQMTSPTVLAFLPAMTVLFVVATMASMTALVRHLKGQRLTFGGKLDCALMTALTATACGCIFVSTYQYEASVSIVSEPFSGLCPSVAKQFPACRFVTTSAVTSGGTGMDVWMTAGVFAQHLTLGKQRAILAAHMTRLAGTVSEAGVPTCKWESNFSVI